jgi:hypothetical protein
MSVHAQVPPPFKVFLAPSPGLVPLSAAHSQPLIRRMAEKSKILYTILPFMKESR